MTDDDREAQVRRMLAEDLGVDPDDLVALNPREPANDVLKSITDLVGLPEAMTPDYNAVHKAASIAAADLADRLWDAHIEARENDPSVPEQADVDDDAVRSFLMTRPDETLFEWGIPPALWQIITAFTALHQTLIDAVIDTHTEALRSSLRAKNITNSAEADFDAAIHEFLGGNS